MKIDGRSKSSAINGKKGGRPLGAVDKRTIEARLQREYLIEQFEKHLAPIVETALAQAEAGNKDARDWLTEHAWGKAVSRQELTGKDGKDLFTPSEAVKKLADELLTKQRGTSTSE